jgi:sulfite oxidase
MATGRRKGLLAVRDITGEAPWGPGATGTARWGGVSLADVLATAGVGPGATHVALIGVDRSEEAKPPQDFGASIPLAKALTKDVLLALEMNGEPLSPVHGAPVRLVVPGYIGARSVKWLQRVELRSEPSDGYFQERPTGCSRPSSRRVPESGWRSVRSASTPTCLPLKTGSG